MPFPSSNVPQLQNFCHQDITLLITVGEDNNGQMALIGQEEVVSSLGPKYVYITIVY